MVENAGGQSCGGGVEGHLAPIEWWCPGGCDSGVIEQQEAHVTAGSNRAFDSTG